MAQPVKKNIKENIKPSKKISKKGKRNHKEYGTSKLEEKFMHEFLDRLNIKYDYQYKAESIGRYFDFMVYGNEKNPHKRCAIEVDGDYWHSYNVLYEDMTPTQKRNKRVDEQKNRWCKHHSVTLIRIWEHDINNDPQGVMKFLKNHLEKYIRDKDDKRRDY